MLTESIDLVDDDARENCAQQLEVVRDFCIFSLEQFNKVKRTKAAVIKRKSA
jgi:hypothetical protein